MVYDIVHGTYMNVTVAAYYFSKRKLLGYHKVTRHNSLAIP